MAGRADRTAEVVREVFDKFYHPAPDGLCGNDDCGQMSAWYIFSALGFYPVNPVGGTYVLGAPQLSEVTLTLPDGKTFTVVAEGLSPSNKYVKAIRLNGQAVADYTISHEAILRGGTLVFEMTDDPSASIHSSKNKPLMNHLSVTKVGETNLTAAQVSAAFDRLNIPSVAIANVNWPDSYPYCPDVKFRIAHNGTAIYLNYQVEEQFIKAVTAADNGAVWEDSCCEFFLSFGGEGYFNIETNCIGKVLMHSGARPNRVPVADKLRNSIHRWSSLGNQPVDLPAGNWEMSLVIPIEVFSLDGVTAFDGLEATANFYKCGDKLRRPHFLSWNAIQSEHPNFHLPQFFGRLTF
jgi:hypothetical protein